jgi:UV DNA damage endonuclease
MLKYNIAHDMLFFRITSDLVPFASHPICRFDWPRHFRADFDHLGELIAAHGIRISMHPDQFTLINSKDITIFRRSVAELDYHARVLDLLHLDASAKIQIHVGGVYGDKQKSMARFIRRCGRLPKRIRRRLVIENDDGRFHFGDCLHIHGETGIPVLLDSLHHAVYNEGQELVDVLEPYIQTWQKRDGIPMLDYSSQEPGRRPGKHVETIDIDDFRRFLKASRPYDFDIMLEIKDKEVSAGKAVRSARKDLRFRGAFTGTNL